MQIKVDTKIWQTVYNAIKQRTGDGFVKMWNFIQNDHRNEFFYFIFKSRNQLNLNFEDVWDEWVCLCGGKYFFSPRLGNSNRMNLLQKSLLQHFIPKNGLTLFSSHNTGFEAGNNFSSSTHLIFQFKFYYIHASWNKFKHFNCTQSKNKFVVCIWEERKTRWMYVS